MIKRFGRKTLSIFCALLIVLSVTVSVLTVSVGAAEPITQSFENITELKSVKYFSIYEATSADDTNVYDGSKSLKWTNGSGTDAVSFWQSGMDLTVGQLYKVEMYIKLTAANSNSMVLKQLSARDNGWTATGTDFTVDTSKLTVGEWSKYTLTFTAEQRAMGMYIYGTSDVYFDYFVYTPVTSDKVTVTLNANNGQSYDALSGTPGDAMALPTVTNDGMSFAGWYSDAELKTPFTDTAVFPEKNITLYAKWLPEGTVMQDFEVGYSISDSSSGFSVYTATGDDDTNVKDGTKSLKWTATSGSKVATLWCTGKDLTVGETYKMEAWIKAETSTGSGIKFTQLNDAKNGWSYANNTQFGLSYFGTNYDSIGEWKKFEVTFTAEKSAMGILIYGADNFYFDAFKWTPLKEDVTVDFVTNNGTEVEQAKGASGMALQLPTLTKEGYYFAGWFTDAEFTEAFSQTTFPEASTTIYAKWIENGVITQNFESYDLTLSADSGFELYTASDENDENVYEGKHSLYRTNINKTKVVSLSDKYTSLTVGKAYKVTYKIKITDLGTGGGLSLTNISVRDNPWSYKSFMSIGYIGSDYKHLNEWTEQSFVFIAENPYFGFSNWGNITYYVDDFKIVEVPIVTVSFEMGEGEAIEPMTGAADATMKVNNPTPPEGKAFGGWYLDPEFTERYTISTFPEKDITLYARWIKEGTFEQDYETWPDKTGVYLTSNVFTLYTAEDENDPNVYHGKHSMLYDNPEGKNTYALGIFDTEVGKLTVGEKYYVSIRFKPVEMYSYSNINKTYTYHSIYYTTQQSNVWTYTSQGPQGKYVSSLFKDTYTEVGDEDWSGTSNLVTTTTSKDENGWLTMTYEIEAKAPYIALYMTGNYSMYIDYITIEPLPSGIISENYENPYCEDFYNILVEQDIAETPNNNETKIYKLELETRSDYIFTASLMKGVYGDCKVYLAWDEEGKKAVDGTVFNGNGTDYKLYSSRIMTDFTGILYLVVEGAGPGSCDYFALFKTKYGCEEDPNPYYVRPTVNYNTLPQKVASTDTLDISTDDDGSPLTGDKGVLLPCILLCVTAAAVLVILRKRGAENEK